MQIFGVMFAAFEAVQVCRSSCVSIQMSIRTSNSVALQSITSQGLRRSLSLCIHPNVYPSICMSNSVAL